MAIDKARRGQTQEILKKKELKNLTVELTKLITSLRVTLSSAETLLAHAEEKLAGGIDGAGHELKDVSGGTVVFKGKVSSVVAIEEEEPWQKKEREFREVMSGGPPYKTEKELEASGIVPVEMRDGFLFWLSPDKKWCMFTLNRKSSRPCGDMGKIGVAPQFERINCKQDDDLEGCVVTPAYVYDQDGDLASKFADPYFQLIKVERIGKGTIRKN